jgi:sodium-dependent phosphate cotransporter
MPSPPDPAARSVRKKGFLRRSIRDWGFPRSLPLPTLRSRLLRVVLFLISVWLFVVAIELVKSGAQGAASLVERYLNIQSMAHALGFGWFSTYVVMSGSPVAAVSVAFLDAGALDQLQAFAMITGSRLGASFIVLFIGFVYVLRGYERRTGLTMGLLSLIVTGSVYLPALAVGALLLDRGLLDKMQFDSGAALSSTLDRVLKPVVSPIADGLPGWAVFLVGMGVLWLSFFLFDRVLPDLHLEQSRFARVARLVYRPAVMLLLGAVLTLITLSVSLSLSLLVPLSARGYVRRENVIPYIMGANITTFIDTLLATVVLGNADAFTVVLVSMFSVTLVSLVVLLLFFRRYEQVMLMLVEWVAANNRNLALFMFTILIVPLVLMLV